MSNEEKRWNEELSHRYLDYGRYFVPSREEQMHIMVALLKGLPQPGLVLELCCGEGLLAEMVLEGLPGATLLGLDGSTVMLERAQERLSRFSGRFQIRRFNLMDRSWRRLERPAQAVLTSLAIHHLDGEGKRGLFQDVYAMLAEGGAFIVADVIDPASQPGREVAADALDEVVRQRSLALDGNTVALDFFLGEGWNTFRYFDPDDIDHPSRLFDQLQWLEKAGFVNVDVHFVQAGHALFSGWKLPG